MTAEAFRPDRVGATAAAEAPLDSLLVTGDSLSTPLDSELARRLAPAGVDVMRDPDLGTGSPDRDRRLGELSTTQVARDHPDAVVVFMGANEGFPMPGPAARTSTAAGPPGPRSTRTGCGR